MGYDHSTQQMHELTSEFIARLTPEKREQMEKLWSKFREGEIVEVRNQADIARPFAKFKIVKLGENRMELIALGASP